MRDPFASAPEAVGHFAARLTLYTDVADVHAALHAAPREGGRGFVLVDSRATAAWDAGHVPGAVHLPTARIPELAPRLVAPAAPACHGTC